MGSRGEAPGGGPGGEAPGSCWIFEHLEYKNDMFRHLRINKTEKYLKAKYLLLTMILQGKNN